MDDVEHAIGKNPGAGQMGQMLRQLISKANLAQKCRGGIVNVHGRNASRRHLGSRLALFGRSDNA
jgi:hypothetical protein